MRGESGHDATGTGRLYAASGGYRSEWETQIEGGSSRKDEQSAASKRFKMTMLGKRSDPDKMYMLNDEHKTYSVMDLKKIREDAKNVSHDTYTVEKLGKDTVAGLSCQKATLTTSKGAVFDVCMSTEWGTSSEWISSMSRTRDSGSWFAALKEKGVEGFPLRFAMRHKGSTEPSMVMEVTHVDRKSLPSSLFEVPPGYKETDTAIGGLTPEQEKQLSQAREQMKDALDKMTPEQRKAYEDAMKKYAQPTPKP
jgi:hypothetical protein